MQYKRGGADQWEVIELPAIMPSGILCGHEFWKLGRITGFESLTTLISKWMAQVSTRPYSEEGCLVKRDGGKYGKVENHLIVSLLFNHGIQLL